MADHQVTVASPFDEKQQGQLNWYFEEHLRFLFTDQVRARRAGESIKGYGEALFGQLIANSKVREACGALKGRAYSDRFHFEVIGSPAFQAPHWGHLKIRSCRIRSRLTCR